MNSLTDYLPEIFRDGSLESVFFRTFDLFLFDHRVDANNGKSSLSETIISISSFYDPEKVPSNYLKWLSEWVALGARFSLDERIQRLLIKNANYIHAYGGTRKGLLDVLDIVLNFRDVNARTDEGRNKEFGRDLILSEIENKSLEIKINDGGLFVFDIVFSYQDKNDEEYIKKRGLIKSVVSMVKPAYVKANYSD